MENFHTMTHELQKLISTAHLWFAQGKQAVMAAVVHLEGSSYRRPGVSMLISEAGDMVGAVSGGCVEKEIIRQAASVFRTGMPKLMTYDGRFRLGCEGVLYVLIEPVEITDHLFQVMQKCFHDRKPFQSTSFFITELGESAAYGTVLEVGGTAHPMRGSFRMSHTNHLQTFRQQWPPLFRLYIFGAEHDAVQLCHLAADIGWQVHVIAAPGEEKTIAYFKGATRLSATAIQDLDLSDIDENSAVILMSHSLHKDAQYLMALKDSRPAYIGLLGPRKRRERLLEELINYFPDTADDFLDSIHGPAGLNIGAETPAEIALSIISEILSITRKAAVMPLRELSGKIHG
ncbi:XdhC family protein [Niabella insulamsoli]|uniref:XdhC family protein n=1 Tax=Niabella insulamsoli TaxID=3144874 RepID=UPI0031FCBB8C